MKFHHHLLHLSHYQGWWEACGSSIIQRGLLRLEYVLKVLLRHQEILGIYKWWCYSLQLSLSQAFIKTWQQREQLLSSINIFFVINVFDPTNLTSCISHYLVHSSLSSSLHFSKWSPISYSTLLQGRLLKNLFKSLFKFDRYCILKRQTLKAKDWAGVWSYYKMMCKQHSTVPKVERKIQDGFVLKRRDSPFGFTLQWYSIFHVYGRVP